MAFPQIGLEAVLLTQDFQKGTEAYLDGISRMQKAGEKMIDVGGKLTKSVTLPIIGLGAATVKLAADAAKMEQVRDGFTKFAESVGVDAVEALNSMRTATKGLIPDVELMQTANKALAGSSDAVKQAFLENLPAIQAFALRASQVQGIPLDITLDKFVTGLKRMSPMLIDDTGLTLKLSEVTEKAQEIFGKTTTSVIDNTKAMGKSQARIQKLKNQITLVNLKVGEFTDKTKDSTKATSKFKLDELNEQLRQETEILTDLTREQGRTVTEAEAAATSFSKEEQQLALLRVVAEKMAPEMAALGDVQIGLAERMAIATTKAANMRQELGVALIPVVEVLMDTVNELVDSLTEASGGIIKTVTEFVKANPEVVKMAIAFAGIAAAIGPVLIVVGKILTVLGALNPIMLLVTGAVIAFAVAWKEDFAGIRSIVEGISDTLQAFGKFIQAVVEDGDTLNDWLTHIPEPLRNVAKFLGEVVKEAKEFAEGIADAIQRIVKVFEAEGIAGVAKRMGENISGAIKEAFGTKATKILDAFVGNVSRGLKDIQSAFEERGLTGAIQELGRQVSGVIEDVFGPTTARVLDTFVGDVSRGLKDIQSAFEERGLRGAIRELGDQVLGVVEKAFGAEVAKVLDTFVGDVSRGLKDIQSAFQEKGLQGAIQELGEQVFAVIEEAFGAETAKTLSIFVEDVSRGLGDIQAAFEEKGLEGAIQELGEQVFSVIENAFSAEATEAIVKFVDNVKVFLSDIQTAFEDEGIEGAIRVVGENVFNAIENAFSTETASLIANFVAASQEHLQDIVKAFQEGGVSEAAKEVGEKIFAVLEDKFGAEAAETIATYADNTIEFLSNIKAGYDEAGITGAIETFGKELTKNINEAFGADTTDTIAEYTNNTIEFLDSIKAGYDDAGAIGAIQSFGQELFDSIDEAFGAETASIIAEFAENSFAFVSDIVTAYQDSGLQGAIDEFGAQVKKSVEEAFGSDAVKAVEDFGETVNTTLDNIRKAFEEGKVAESIVTGAVGLFLKVSEAIAGALFGEDARERFRLGLEELRLIFSEGRVLEVLEFAAGELGRAIITSLVSALEPVQEVWDTLTRIGESIVEGIKTGIEGAWKTFEEKIEELIGRIPEGIRKFLGIGSPSKLFAEIGFDMALGLALGFREGMSEQDLTFAKTVADTVSAISKALTDAFSAFQEVGGFGGVAKEAVDALISDIEFVLIQVRTRLLDLWGWAGARQDTVWGHMAFWADAVKDIVGVVGDAVAVFKEMKDFTGVMPGVIDLVVSDLQKVLSAMAVVDVGTVSASLVQWAEFAADIVSAIASVVGDLGKLAAFEGPLTVQLGAIHGLMNTLVGTVSTIGRALDGLNLEIGFLDALKAKWVEFADGLISTLAGMIDDLRTLAAFEGSLIIPLRAVENLVTALSIAVTTVLGAMSDVSSLFEEETVNAVDRFKAAWLEFSSGLVSTLAGVIEDLRKLSAFEGGISISSTGLANIVQALWDLTENIRDWLPDLADRFEDNAVNAVDRFKAAWLEFQAGLASTLAGTIEDLRALSAFEGGVSISRFHLANIVQELWDLTENIRDWLPDLSDRFENDAVNATDRFKAAWLEFQAGLASTLAGVIEDLKALAAFEGDLVVVQPNVKNLVDTLGDVANWILEEIGDIASDFQAEGSVDQLKASWADFAGGLVSTVAGVIGDLTDLAAFKGGLAIAQENVLNLIEELNATATTILKIAGEVSAGDVLISEVDRIKAEWAEFAAGLVSMMAGVISDLETLALFEGGLSISADSVINLVDEMEVAARTIMGALDAARSQIISEGGASFIDDIQVQWAEFAAGIVSIVAGAIDDLTTLAAFKGGLSVSTEAVTNLIDEMEVAAKTIIASLDAVKSKIIAGGGVSFISEIKVLWAEFAGEIVSVMAGAIDDLMTIAAFEGGLSVSTDAVTNLVDEMEVAAKTIIGALDAVRSQLSTGGGVSFVNKIKVLWAEFAGEIISVIAGTIDDLTAITAFEGGLSVSAEAVTNLVDEMEVAAKTIIGALDAVKARITSGGGIAFISEVKVLWAEFAGEIVSMMAGAISDLTSLAAFEGGLSVSAKAVVNLVDEMEVAAKAIIGALDAVKTRISSGGAVTFGGELKAQWAAFAGGIIGAVTGTIDDLTALAAFKGELVVSGDNVILLVDEMKTTAATILDAMADMTSKFDKEGALNKVDEFKAKWTDFAGGLISSVAGTITDLETLAAFKGRLDVQPRKVEKVLDAMTTVMQAISDHMTTNAPKMQAILVILEDWGADWLEVVGDLLGTVIAIKDNLEDIGTLETRTISVKIGARNVMDNLTVAMQMIADGLVNFQVIMKPFDLSMLQGIADQAVTLTTTIREAIETFNWMLDVPLSENTGLIGSFVGAFAEALGLVSAAFSGTGGVTEGIRAAWDAMWTAVVAVTRSAVDDINAILDEIPRTITVVVETVTDQLPSGGESIPLMPSGGEAISLGPSGGEAISLGGRSNIVTAPAPPGQSISISQTFSISPTVSGTFQIQEEGDIATITDAVVEAMRDELGDITSRTIRTIGG